MAEFQCTAILNSVAQREQGVVPLLPWALLSREQNAYTGIKLPMHARKDIAMCFYTTRITHLAKSTRLHYTMDVVLLTQLCMVVASPVQGIGSCNSLSLPHLLSRQFHFTSSRGFSQSPVSIKAYLDRPIYP